MDIATKLTQIAEKEAENIELNASLEQTLYGTDTGGKSYYDEFWDSVQQNGNKVDYTYCFYRWGGEYLHPKYKIVPKFMKANDGNDIAYEARYYNMVYGCPNLKRIEKKYFDLSQYENEKGYHTKSTYGNYYTFSANARLEVIEDVGMQPYYYYNTFRWCPKLHTIEVVRSNEKTKFDTQWVNGCYELQNITIEGMIASNISFHTNGKLTKESIRGKEATQEQITAGKNLITIGDKTYYGGIIAALSDSVGATLTLSQSAVNNAFGSTSSEDWIELITPKSNQYNGLWTISLI